MATFTATVSIEVNIEVQCPDSKLKAILSGEDYTDWVDDAIGNAKANGKHNYVSASCNSFDIIEVVDICKDNGDEYEWDGDKLSKI